MTDSTDEYVALAKRLLGVALFALAVMVLVAVIDYRLKREIVREADRWREEIRGQSGDLPVNWRRPRSEQRAGPAVPDPVHMRDAAGPVADGAGGEEGESPGRAVPIVKPGSESNRPPHRGGVHGP